MSRARPVFEGDSLLITRRVHGQQFLLHPCVRTDGIIWYVLAVAAKRYRMQLHAVVVLSDHWHVVVTDPGGRVCEFTRYAHSMITRALNAEYGDTGSLWDGRQTSHVVCVEPQDVVDKMVYTMANPVKAGLVQRGESWPGIRGAWPAKPVVVKRTGKFFRDAGSEAWPEEVMLEFARPPGYEEVEDGELGGMIGEAIEAREAEHRAAVLRAGMRFLGVRGLRRQTRRGRARSRRKREKKGRAISPRVACKNEALRVERLARNRAWLEAYRAALQRWRAGDREAEFPAGTYKMRVLHGVRVVESPG